MRTVRVVNGLDGLHVLEPAGGAAGAFGVHAVGGGKRHVRGAERTAVRPHHVVPQPPGNRQKVRRNAAVLDGWNLRGQRRDHAAVLVIARQRLQNQRRRVDVLGSPRQKRVQDRRRLPVEHPQLAVAAALGHGRGHEQQKGGQGQDEQSRFQSHRQPPRWLVMALQLWI